MIAALVTLALLAIVVTLTVCFYIGGGRYNRWINYGAPLLACATILSRKILSPTAFMLWLIALSWLLYLIATNLFTGCRTVTDFLSAYRPRCALVITSLLVIYSAVDVIRSVTAETVLVCMIAIVLWMSYAKLLSYPRGETAIYKISLSILACLWMLLAIVLGEGKIYDVQSSESGIAVSWRLMNDGKLNLPALESMSSEIVLKYFAVLSISYLFFIFGILYHGMLHERARPVALRSYAILLIMMVYCAVPELRSGLVAVPRIGPYLSSPGILLCGMLLSMIAIMAPRRDDRGART